MTAPVSAFGVVDDRPEVEAVEKGMLDNLRLAARVAGKHPRAVDYLAKHPGVAGAAYLGTFVGGRALGNGIPAARRAGFARKLAADPARAEKLAADLVPHRSPVVSAKPGLREMRTAGKKQRAVHVAAVKGNRDIARLRPTSTAWSHTMTGSRKVKAGAELPLPSRTRAFLRPKKHAPATHGNTLRSVLGGAKAEHSPELFRSMNVSGTHKPGETLDFGRMSSWTTDRTMADRIGTIVTAREKGARRLPKPLQRGRNAPYAPPGAKPATYRRPAGAGPAANLSGASRTHGMNEWIAGGKHKVTSTPSPDKPWYTVKPVGKRLSAFGVAS